MKRYNRTHTSDSGANDMLKEEPDCLKLRESPAGDCAAVFSRCRIRYSAIAVLLAGIGFAAVCGAQSPNEKPGATAGGVRQPRIEVLPSLADQIPQNRTPATIALFGRLQNPHVSAMPSQSVGDPAASNAAAEHSSGPSLLDSTGKGEGGAALVQDQDLSGKPAIHKASSRQADQNGPDAKNLPPSRWSLPGQPESAVNDLAIPLDTEFQGPLSGFAGTEGRQDPGVDPLALPDLSSGIADGVPASGGPDVPSHEPLQFDRIVEPWWHARVAQKVTGQSGAQPIDVCMLVQEGLRSSRQIQALSQDPLIRETEIAVALAEFDPGLYARSLYDDRVDPVGNALTTGGLPFLKDNIWTGEAGFRQKLPAGGNLRVSQQLGFHNSNSRFFTPQDQGTATLAINFEQPLMRGRGRYYNRSQIFLAETATAEANDEFSGKLQTELNEIVTSYWILYSSRAQLLQREKNYELGLAVLKRLEGRAEFDTQPLQLAQARAAVTAREAALANARRDVLIAETEIRRLLTAANWAEWQNVELLTVEPPLSDPETVSVEAAVYSALENRPELRQGAQRVKAAAIRNNITSNQLMPELKLLFGTYVAALEGESDIGLAWTRQFTGSTPGFSAGLQYDFPWRNRAARGRHQKAALEYTRAQMELEQITVNVIVDAQQSWYRLATSRERIAAGLEAMAAAEAELKQNEMRWDNAAIVEGDWSDGQTQSLILDQLLISQQKLFDAERVVAESEQELKLAQVNLKRATGTLLGYCQGVSPGLTQPGDTTTPAADAVAPPESGLDGAVADPALTENTPGSDRPEFRNPG